MYAPGAMNDRPTLTQQTLSVWLTALLLLMSVAVPVLERSELGRETAVESEHDPAHCPPGHDHTVCTQVSSNLAAPTAPGYAPEAGHVFGWTAPTATYRAIRSALAEGHPTRGPPTV